MLTQEFRYESILEDGVAFIERDHPFDDADVECMARLGRFVAQEMQKTDLYVASRRQMDSYFLVSLLNDEQPSHAMIARRLSVLDFRPLPELYLAVFDPNHADVAPCTTSTR